MEEQSSPLNWAYYYQEEGVDGYLYSRLMELEAAILRAHEEISRKDDEILQLKDLLANILRGRDEFQVKCQALVSENQQQLAQMKTRQHSNCATSDDEYMSLSTSNCDESTTWSPTYKVPSSSSSSSSSDKCWPCEKPLPQNGKFLQAVMEAGPLLRTLLLAGPLPRWQHPPPPLNSTDIPPFSISPNTATPPTSAEHSCL